MKSDITSRHTALKKFGVGLLGATGATTLAGTASADWRHNPISIKYKGYMPGTSKLTISMTWFDGPDKVVVPAEPKITGSAGAVGHSFKGVSYVQTEGGDPKSYYHVYAEAEYTGALIGSYLIWLGVTVYNGGAHAANSNRHKKLVYYTGG